MCHLCTHFVVFVVFPFIFLLMINAMGKPEKIKGIMSRHEKLFEGLKQKSVLSLQVVIVLKMSSRLFYG
jgi:hypothetical protein